MWQASADLGGDDHKREAVKSQLESITGRMFAVSHVPHVCTHVRMFVVRCVPQVYTHVWVVYIHMYAHMYRRMYTYIHDIIVR